jgi:hypothetical protein
MSDVQLRAWVDAIWAKAQPLPAEPEGVVAFHDGVDMLVEVRGKCFAIEFLFSPALLGLPAPFQQVEIEVLL